MSNDELTEAARRRDPDTLIATERLDEVRRAYAAIAGQIEMLRSLDLRDIHPAVVYRPLKRQKEPS